ncbi:nitroreductase family protein [Rhabdothermincola sp. EGI L10124]|nr:nitroreductase family protein [Rhabdothermincola salaria]MCD9623276.1 nitroreductase family protein [Rhabdothermincola salaria]
MGQRDSRLAVVEQFFEGPRQLDRLDLMTDDVEWWNGLGRFPAAPGQTVFRGKDEIGRLVLGRAPSPPQPNGRRVDRYDLTTARFDDVHVVADGAYVFRQHTYRATTRAGRPYENVYGFLFRFADDDRIDRIWEHWGTLTAYETLFQGPLVVHDPDLLLQTTPSVRRRLDLERPVERDVLEECLDLAVHAPNGSNTQPYRFLFVDDADRRAALADIYRAAMADFVARPRTDAAEDNVDRSGEAQQRIARSVAHLAEHLHEVPVLCVPLVAGRTDGAGAGAHADRTSAFWQANRWGSVIPALWSFMLALRSRGLGSAWTTLTLVREREVAEVLDIPFEKWMQVGLFPIAHTIGTDFRPTPRRPAAEMMRWNAFRGD